MLCSNRCPLGSDGGWGGGADTDWCAAYYDDAWTGLNIYCVFASDALELAIASEKSYFSVMEGGFGVALYDSVEQKFDKNVFWK